MGSSCDQTEKKSERPYISSQLQKARELIPPQKCDAKHPCTTCVDRDRIAECQYGRCRSIRDAPLSPARSPPRDITHPALSDSSEPSSSHFLSPDLRKRSSAPPKQLEWKPAPRVLYKVVPDPSSNASVVENAPGSTGHPPCPAVSSFTVLPSVHFQTIPRPLQIPLSVICPEYMQVSSVAGDDQGMILYVLFHVSGVLPSWRD